MLITTQSAGLKDGLEIIYNGKRITKKKDFPFPKP